MKKIVLVFFLCIQGFVYAQVEPSVCSKGHFMVGTDLLYDEDLWGTYKEQGGSGPPVIYHYNPKTSTLFYNLSAWVGYFPADNVCFGVGMARPQVLNSQAYSPITPFLRYYIPSANAFSSEAKRSRFFIELSGFVWGTFNNLNLPGLAYGGSTQSKYTTIVITPGLGYTYLITKKFALEIIAQYNYTHYTETMESLLGGQVVPGSPANTLTTINTLNCLLRAQFYFGQ